MKIHLVSLFILISSTCFGQVGSLDLSFNVGDTVVHVYNQAGKLLLEVAKNRKSTNIDLSDNQKGIYIARVQTDQGVQVLKAVVQ